MEDVIVGNLKEISIVTMDQGCSGDNQLQDTIVANVSTKAWIWCLQECDILP